MKAITSFLTGIALSLLAVGIAPVLALKDSLLDFFL